MDVKIEGENMTITVMSNGYEQTVPDGQTIEMDGLRVAVKDGSVLIEQTPPKATRGATTIQSVSGTVNGSVMQIGRTGGTIDL